MKKSILLFLSGVLSFAVSAQIIVTNPAFVTRDYAGTIEIILESPV